MANDDMATAERQAQKFIGKNAIFSKENPFRAEDLESGDWKGQNSGRAKHWKERGGWMAGWLI
jgi:hypothetical protein